jgi:predicted nucleic acid-binding protein
VAIWGEAPSLRFLSEGGRHFERLSDLALSGRIRGAMIHDARIAAICLEHGVSELWTADRDFGRFPALKTRNPLVG